MESLAVAWCCRGNGRFACGEKCSGSSSQRRTGWRALLCVDQRFTVTLPPQPSSCGHTIIYWKRKRKYPVGGCLLRWCVSAEMTVQHKGNSSFDEYVSQMSLLPNADWLLVVGIYFTKKPLSNANVWCRICVLMPIYQWFHQVRYDSRRHQFLKNSSLHNKKTEGNRIHCVICVKL